MITRAYQNAKGERQEISLLIEEWDELTEDGLQKMLGFHKEPAAAAAKTAPKTVSDLAKALKKKRR